MSANEFIRKFHDLEGVTIAEKQKSFNKLMLENKSLLEDPNISREIINNLKANSYLEDRFRIEMLLASHYVPELFEILKNGDEIVIKKIVKHKWVFKEAFYDLTPSQIMDDLVPHLSYSVRIKLMKGLTGAFENEEKLSALFDCYKTKYGLPDALPMLFGCSVDKIESVIKSNAVFLTRSQVIKLLRRAPQLFPVYVEERIKHTGNCDYLFKDERFIKMLASKYFDLFELLKMRYKFNVCFGRRTTKKVFEKEKEKILIEPGKYKDNLKLSVFVRKLGEKGLFKQYFKEQFPKSVEDFSCSDEKITSLLSQYPKNKRYHLLKEAFEEAYNLRFIDCPNKIVISALELMCCEDDEEERSEAAAMMLRETRNVEYVVYQQPAKSIPYLKREINLSSSLTQRQRLVSLLVNTCKINNDMASLIQVVEYVTVRHKNEGPVVLEFFRCLERLFDMHEFKKELWDAIIDLVNIYFLMNPKEIYCGKILLHYAEFKYNTGESITESIAKYRARDELGFSLFAHNCKNKKFLEQAVKEFMVLLLEKGLDEDWSYYRLFADFDEWTTKHQVTTISYLDYPKLLDMIRKIANSDYNYWVSDFICSKDRNVFIEELSELYWRTLVSTTDKKVIVYFFRWYPLLLLKHKDSFFNAMLNENYQRIEYILRWMKRYDHLEFPQEVVRFCKDKFISENKIESQVFETLFTLLIRFMRPEDFINYTIEYKPKDLSLDNWENDKRALYSVHSSIAKSFRHTQHTREMLPLLMSYCGGDFLKHVLPSLYKYVHHNPYNIWQSCFDQLASSPVSVRKHAVFLTCRIGDLESKEKILKSFISMEKNMSLQKQFMLLALYSFLKYYSLNFWELFITSLVSLKDNDKESFKKLVCPNKIIPKCYFSLYYKEIWDLVEKKNLNSSLKCSLRNNLVKQINLFIADFPPEFCYKVVDSLFLKFSDDSSYDSDINNFIYKFLLHHRDPDRFRKIINILQSSKTSQTDNIILQGKIKKEIRYFINRFCGFYLSSDENEKWDKKHLLEFADQLLSLYNPVDIFSDYLLLSFTSKLVASKDLKDYAQKAAILIDDLLQRYGVYFLKDLATAICLTLMFFYKGNESKNAVAEFIHDLLNVKSTEANQVLCLLILLNNDDSNKPGFRDCLKMFEESKIPYIQVTLERRGH